MFPQIASFGIVGHFPKFAIERIYNHLTTFFEKFCLGADGQAKPFFH